MNIIEEKTPEETQETSKPSGKVEIPEAAKPQEEKKPVEEKAPEEAPKPVEEKKPEEVKPKVEEKKEEVPPVEKKEEGPTSLIDDLLETAAEKEAKKAAEAKKPGEATPTQGIDRAEIDVARAIYPQLDPHSTEYDREFEREVVKEYMLRWVEAEGKATTGPTFREVASQLSFEKKAPEKKAEKEKETKKGEATAGAPSVPSPKAESSITAEKEEELKAAVRRGNKGAIVELLRARRKETKEAE